MPYRQSIDEIGRLGAGGEDAAGTRAERIVDAHMAGFSHHTERSLALDALLRDLARLRRREPALDGFITGVEAYIDALHRDLVRRAA
ncbi:hypothetical protein [Methylobacterium sp. J-076]|uniref:hypothetical protein n=1 Tax=Methylobacterium sp. J-076 TaxID=2836655 RepID=UPI001FBBE1DE|nr:hypothetical protein [Methylobacterium sp. J-076]MCJ2015363.1 hypothetical protein [Methylobacterium sp. J-076]